MPQPKLVSICPSMTIRSALVSEANPSTSTHLIFDVLDEGGGASRLFLHWFDGQTRSTLGGSVLVHRSTNDFAIVVIQLAAGDDHLIVAIGASDFDAVNAVFQL